MAKKPAPTAPSPAPAPAPAPAPVTTPPALFSSDTFPATFDLPGGATATLGDVVRAAFEATGATVDAWNEFDQPWRDAAISAALNAMGVTWPPEPVAEQAQEVVADAAARAAAEDAAPEVPEPVDLGPDVTVTMLVSMSGAICYVKGDAYVCSAAEAIRLRDAAIANPATDDDVATMEAYLASQPST